MSAVNLSIQTIHGPTQGEKNRERDKKGDSKTMTGKEGWIEASGKEISFFPSTVLLSPLSQSVPAVLFHLLHFPFNEEGTVEISNLD